MQIYNATKGQQDLWLSEQKSHQISPNNLVKYFKLSANVKPEILKIAFEKFILRHEILSANFYRVEQSVKFSIPKELGEFQFKVFIL